MSESYFGSSSSVNLGFWKLSLEPGQQALLYCTPECFKSLSGASLVVQLSRIHLPMQGTRVWSLAREDSTCHGATKSVRHNYRTCALEPTRHNYWSPRTYSLCSTTRGATAMRSPSTATKSRPRWPQLEKAHAQQQRPNAAKSKNK